MMMMIVSMLALAAPSIVVAAAPCKCTSESFSCWPTAIQWTLLNLTIDGQLVAPTPPAYPCYLNPSSQACQNAVQNWTNPFWRADQPGAMQYPDRESASPSDSCPLPILNSTTPSPAPDACRRGSVSPFAVAALTPSHVQSALLFASSHNLRISVKTTGHDNMGRSASPGSLNIWLHNLRQITFRDAPFVPAGCRSRNSHNNSTSRGGAVTVGAGVQWRDLYQAADSHGVVVVGAMSASVSAIGGFLQGGGHSPLSPLLGLAADNVLELSVVIPNGSLVNASACENTELFWALRGGGGGTFGVVASATLRTYPALTGLVRVSQQVVSSNATAFGELLAAFLSLQATLSDEGRGWAGYSYITSQPEFALVLEYVLPNATLASTETEVFDRVLGEVIRRHEAEGVMRLLLSVEAEVATFGQWHSAVLCGTNPTFCSDATGSSATLASTLVSAEALRERAGEVAEALLEIIGTPEIAAIVGHLVGGGAVAKVPRDFNSVNPAWRKSVWHVVLEAPLPGRGEGDPYEAATRMNQVLRRRVNVDGTPAAAYLNEADPREERWQQTFFGEHYGDLVAIKRGVDPNGLLTCRRCVGSSESYDDDESKCQGIQTTD